MTLGAGCPRCAAPVTEHAGTWSCLDHGPVTPLWRPAVADYESFAEHVLSAGTMPTYAPWPMPPGWTVTDFGCVAAPAADGRASFTSCAGSSEPDGVVELTVVSEEPGVGLGARCAGFRRTDPGAEIGDGPPHVKVRIEGYPFPLWYVAATVGDLEADRSVFAGEAEGRWLWLVLRPAPAALMLQEELLLRDVGQFGPELIDLPFGGSPPVW